MADQLLKTIKFGDEYWSDRILLLSGKDCTVLQFGSGHDEGGGVYEGVGIRKNNDGTITLESYYEGVGGPVASPLARDEINLIIDFLNGG